MFGIEFSKKFWGILGYDSSTSVSNDQVQDVDMCEEIDNENGFVLSIGNNQIYYLPEEILSLILSYVNVHDLTWNCRSVCRSWKRIVETLALKYKTEREYISNFQNGIIYQGKIKCTLPWRLYYGIIAKNIFGRNLLQNNCGQDEFKCWTILVNGGDRWIVENPPNGSDPLPRTEDFEGRNCCFVTSFQSSAMVQTIDLGEEGLVPSIMDKYQPDIVISEWYAGRFDCGCLYELKVKLLDKNKSPIAQHNLQEVVEQWAGREWRQVQHTFKNYGPGVRYISFLHGGKDNQFWAGHYGCKIAGGSVKLFYSLPPAT